MRSRHVAAPLQRPLPYVGGAAAKSDSDVTMQSTILAAALLLHNSTRGLPDASPMGAREGAAVLRLSAIHSGPRSHAGLAAAAATALLLLRSSAGRPPYASPSGARGVAALPRGRHVARKSHSWRAAAAATLLLLLLNSARWLPYASPTGARGGAAVLLRGRHVA